MTRKDRLIAATIFSLVYDEQVDFATGMQIAKRFAEELAMANPRFDTERFMEACFPLAELDRVH